MLMWGELKKAELGQTFDSTDLDRCCRKICGGIGWPGERPGFAVVVAMSQGRDNDAGSHEICLLEEFESSDMPELIKHCGILNSKYEPYMWLSDTTNDSAEEFMYRMRDDLDFHLSETDLIEMNPLYPFLLGTLKELRKEKHRRLFLKNSKTLNYMGDIEEGDAAKLKLGDYPAIEALGFAVIEMLHLVESAGLLPSHTGDWGPEGRAKTIEDLSYRDAIDDLDPDDEDDDDSYYHTM